MALRAVHKLHCRDDTSILRTADVMFLASPKIGALYHPEVTTAAHFS